MRNARDGALWALSVAGGTFQVHRHTNASWKMAFELPAETTADIRGFSEIRGLPVVANDGRVMGLSVDGHILTHPLYSKEERSSALTIEAVDTGDVYIGLDNGEWGGGVRRVRLDGSRVGAPAPAGVNPTLDPVLALVADPRDPACVYGAVGLRHLGLSRGRIVRICGTKTESVFERRLDGGTEAILELAVAGDAVFALGDGFGHKIQGGRDEMLAVPSPTAQCGLTVVRMSGLWLVSVADATGRGKLLAVAQP